MPTFGSIDIVQTGGTLYSDAALVQAVEGDLFSGGVPPDPIIAKWDECIVAKVNLSISGGNATNTTYIVLQGDFGDGQYVDLAWIVWTGTTGVATFLLCAGEQKANAFQFSRAPGTAPGSSGSNSCPLPSRLRFVGKSSTTGAGNSSSAAPGQQTVVRATIRYRLQNLR